MSTKDLLKVQHNRYKGDAKWKDIEDLINRWAKRNPRGALDNEAWIKETREGLFDKKHGVLSNEGMAGGRIGIILHPELEQYIKAFYPDLFETKEGLHEFMRRFPKFKVRSQV